MIRVKIPATSANLGPGFDTLGVALSLYATYEFELIESGLIIEGCEDRFQNEDNLIYVAFKLAMQYMNEKFSGLYMKINTDVPVSRGLGSSATCVVGGIMGANALCNNKLSKEEMLMLATKLEGHPDNVAPAIYGGLCASLMNNNKAYNVNYEINKDIKFIALVPNFETTTKSAREVLPKTVDYKDATYNVSRIAVLLKALEQGNEELILNSLDDKLHQPYRKTLIHEYDEVKRICLDNKAFGFAISGSGSTLMALSKDSNFANNISKELSKLSYNWKIYELEVDHNGARIC